MEKTDIKSLNYEELQEFIKETGEKAFRAKQIYQWMHEKLAEGFDEMTNLSGVLREKLKQTCIYTCLEPVEVLTSKLDGTQKYLFRLTDGQVIESVLMKYHHGNSVCSFYSGGMPDGMPVLRFYHRRPDPGPDYRRIAGPGLPDSEAFRGAGFQSGTYGNRRASG